MSYISPHFTDEETNALRGKEATAKVTQDTKQRKGLRLIPGRGPLNHDGQKGLLSQTTVRLRSRACKEGKGS